MRKTLLLTLCVGGDAESCAFADSSAGAGSRIDEVVEGIIGARCEYDFGKDREAVLAG